jgi:hypothetical protein
VAISAPALLRRSTTGTEAIVDAAYVLGALMLAGEAAVHIHQYARFVHGVRWLGPLFLANAAASVAAIAGLRTGGRGSSPRSPVSSPRWPPSAALS